MSGFFEKDKVIKSLFIIQVVLILLGIIAGDNPDNFMTAQWMSWSVAVLISGILFLLIVGKLLTRKKFDKFVLFVILANIIGIVTALYIHYSPTLG